MPHRTDPYTAGFDHDKVRTTLTQMVRDWSTMVRPVRAIRTGYAGHAGCANRPTRRWQGAQERAASYGPILDHLAKRFPDPHDRCAVLAVCSARAFQVSFRGTHLRRPMQRGRYRTGSRCRSRPLAL